nr:reverse transcriptase domain-containing protein [Tanacetum cinerariifolium]
MDNMNEVLDVKVTIRGTLHTLTSIKELLGQTGNERRRTRDVPNDVIKHTMFPYSLEGSARVWYDKELPNSILTWEDLVNKFVNQFFPPSKTTYLKNEISRFTQRSEETFREARERFKEMLRACPHHGFTELTQIDTFYNGLNDNDQDSLNAATGGNLWSKTTREALENTSKTDDRIDKLADQISTLVDIFAKKFVTPAPVKAVKESCVTCGGPHAHYNCDATNRNQPSVYAMTGTYIQVAHQNRARNCMAPPGFAPVQNSQNRYNQGQGNNFNRGNNFHEITLRVNDEAITFNLNQTARYSSTYDVFSVNQIDVIDIASEEYAQKEFCFYKKSTGGNPTLNSKPISESSPSLTPFEVIDSILEEIEAYLKDDSISPKIDYANYDLERDICLIEKLLNNESSSTFTKFLNPLFDCNDDFTSRNDKSLSNEDIPMENFKIYSNPLFEEANFDLEEILLVENFSYDNSSPRPPEELNVEIADTIVESLSPSPIPIEDSNSHIEKIDLFLATGDLMLSDIENDDYDSEGDVHSIKELLSNDPLPLPKNESSNFDHHDDSSFSHPHSEPPDVGIFFDFEPD